jgi:hypothetical protein
MISPALGENTSHQITLIEVHDNYGTSPQVWFQGTLLKEVMDGEAHI